MEEFTPEESEDRLYHLVSEYLQRDNLQALPASQRSLMTLVLRKLLASSTFAIAGALTSISNRLKAKLRKQEPAESLEDELDQDYEALDETAEEWTDDEPVELLTEADRKALEQEIADLDAFAAAGHFHRPQRQGQGAAQGAGHRLRQGQGTRRRAEGHHLHRIAPHPELPAAPAGGQPVSPKASSSSTAPTPTTAPS